MTIQELIQIAIKKLKNSTPASTRTSPELDGEVLLSFVLKKPKEYLFAHPKKQVNPKSEKAYLRLINNRLLGWPVAYLTKHKEFFGLDFYVDKNVLIPRPETEGLVELTIDKIKDLRLKIKEKKTKDPRHWHRLGMHYYFLAKKLSTLYPKPSTRFYASDVSPQAIKVAKKNAKTHKTKVAFGVGNLLKPWGDENFDVIVANLPYLAHESDISTRFEPKSALIAAKKGLKIYEELFKSLREVRSSDRTTKQSLPFAIFVEIGHDQGGMIKKLAKKFLPAYRTKTYKDLFGRTRYASLEKITQS
jgi:release factor glutamine methyltransferase